MLAGVVGLLCAQQPAPKRPAAPVPATQAAAPATVSKAEAQRMLDNANSLWKQGQYKEANDQFRALVAAVPDNPDYRVRWGELYHERFQSDIASDLFNEALE